MFGAVAQNDYRATVTPVCCKGKLEKRLRGSKLCWSTHGLKANPLCFQMGVAHLWRHASGSFMKWCLHVKKYEQHDDRFVNPASRSSERGKVFIPTARSYLEVNERIWKRRLYFWFYFFLLDLLLLLIIVCFAKLAWIMIVPPESAAFSRCYDHLV